MRRCLVPRLLVFLLEIASAPMTAHTAYSHLIILDFYFLPSRLGNAASAMQMDDCWSELETSKARIHVSINVLGYQRLGRALSTGTRTLVAFEHHHLYRNARAKGATDYMLGCFTLQEFAQHAEDRGA